MEKLKHLTNKETETTMEKKCKKPVRRFPSWSFIDLGSYSVPLSDGTYIFATIENCTDPCDPRLYFAEVIRGIPTGNGTRYERLKGRSFNDLIQALLYLESVALGECETTNE